MTDAPADTTHLPGSKWTAVAPRALVVGAGLAGLRCAEALTAAGWSVTVVDKGRGAGGRASTRRREAGQFDHGAQYFTVRDPAFQDWVDARVARGEVAVWDRPLVRLGAHGATPLGPEPRYVGVPGMNGLLKPTARALGVRFGVRVAALRRVAAGWHATTTEGAGLGPFDRVVVAVPAPQAVPLLTPAASLAARVEGVEVVPCWAVTLTLARPLALPWAGAQVEHGPLAWVAHDGAKPGRDDAPTYVLHARPSWTEAHLEASPAEVAAALVTAFGDLVGARLAPTYQAAHRWRYAQTRTPLGEPCLWDVDTGVGYCGDGCLGGRLEAAFLSGQALADAIGAPAR